MEQEQGKREEKVFPRPRPKRTVGITEQVKTGCGKMYITVNFDQEGMIETFITTGSTGGCEAFAAGVSRLISLALRANVAPEAIIDQLTSVSCPNYIRRRATDPSILGKSCPDIIGRVLTQELRSGNEPETALTVATGELQTVVETYDVADDPNWDRDLDELNEEELLRRGICPDCRASLRHQEGCLVCGNCGYSKCG